MAGSSGAVVATAEEVVTVVAVFMSQTLKQSSDIPWDQDAASAVCCPMRLWRTTSIADDGIWPWAGGRLSEAKALFVSAQVQWGLTQGIATPLRGLEENPQRVARFSATC